MRKLAIVGVAGLCLIGAGCGSSSGEAAERTPRRSGTTEQVSTTSKVASAELCNVAKDLQNAFDKGRGLVTADELRSWADQTETLLKDLPDYDPPSGMASAGVELKGLVLNFYERLGSGDSSADAGDSQATSEFSDTFGTGNSQQLISIVSGSAMTCP